MAVYRWGHAAGPHEHMCRGDTSDEAYFLRADAQATTTARQLQPPPTLESASEAQAVEGMTQELLSLLMPLRSYLKELYDTKFASRLHDPAQRQALWRTVEQKVCSSGILSGDLPFVEY